tara:strand:- start:35 stop:217 length:183 start_codon:yes stop_codon:yes gene_type:complete
MNKEEVLKAELFEVEKLIGEITEKVEEMNTSRERLLVLADTFRSAIDGDQLNLEIVGESE